MPWSRSRAGARPDQRHESFWCPVFALYQVPSPGNATPIESFARLLIEIVFDRTALSNGLHAVRICSLQDVKGILYDSGTTSGPPSKWKFNMIKGGVSFSVKGEPHRLQRVATLLQHASYLQIAAGGKRFLTWGLYLRGSSCSPLQRFVVPIGEEHMWEDSVLVMHPQTLDSVREELSSEEVWAFCDIGKIFDGHGAHYLRIDGWIAEADVSTRVNHWFPLDCLTECKLVLLPRTFSEVYTAILHSHPQFQANF